MVDLNTVINSLLTAGPGWTLVAAILIIARGVWVWAWDETVNPVTGKPRGPAARAVLAYELSCKAQEVTQEEMQKSIRQTAELAISGRAVDDKHTLSLTSIEATIKSIEEQLKTINKNEQSMSTQRVLKMLIATVLQLAQSAGIDVTQHREKFIAFLQDSSFEVPQLKQG